jgi:hypothetical protein
MTRLKLATCIVLVAGVLACTTGKPAALPPGVVDPALCGLRVYGTDVAAGKGWLAILADELTECGLDELAAGRLVAQHKQTAALLAHAPAVLDDGGAP